MKYELTHSNLTSGPRGVDLSGLIQQPTNNPQTTHSRGSLQQKYLLFEQPR